MQLSNVIRCDLSQGEYLVWKWLPPQGSVGRQNQIRFGSSLRVRAGEVAAFFYTNNGTGSPVDYIEGPADLILQTKNLPVLANLIGLAYGGDSPFQAEVYFINRGQAPQIQWGVPWFDTFDPRFPDFPVPVSVFGTITFCITDISQFVRIQRLESFDLNRLRDQILPQLRSALKANVVNLATARGIPLLHIGARVEELSQVLAPHAAKVLDQFGVALRNFVIEGIVLKQDSAGYADLMRVTRDQQKARIETQGELEREAMRAGQGINVKHLDASLEIQREELQRLQRLQTEERHLATHQVNLNAEVARTAAESIGTMGSGGGGGGIGDLGSAVLALGVAGTVGAAFSQQIAGTIQKATVPGSTVAADVLVTCAHCHATITSQARFCSACGKPAASAASPVSFPAPTSVHVARSGQVLGIFTLAEANLNLANGKLLLTDLGWVPGMPQWQNLAAVPGIVAPPPLPGPPPVPPAA